MKSFVIDTSRDNIRNAIKRVVHTYDGTIQVEEHDRMVATFPESKKWKIGQQVSFTILPRQGRSILHMDSQMIPRDRKRFEWIFKLCTIIMAILFILIVFDFIDPFMGLIEAFLAFGIVLLDGGFLILHGSAVNKLIHLLIREFEARDLSWYTESESYHKELSTLTAAVAAITLALSVLIVLITGATVFVILLPLGFLLVIIFSRKSTFKGLFVWKSILASFFVMLAFLISLPSFRILASFALQFVPETDLLLEVLFVLLAFLFGGCVIPDHLRMKEKEFGGSFWVRVRSEYYKAYGKSEEEIHIYEYFGVWLGLNMIVFWWVLYNLIQYVLHFEFFLDNPEIIFDSLGFLFPLRLVYTLPLLGLIYAWAHRSFQSFRLHLHMREPASRTREIASKVLGRLHVDHVHVKSYPSDLVNGGVLYPLFPRKGIILVSSGAEKLLNDLEMECLILHECGHVLNDSLLPRLLNFVSRFFMLGESLFALSVNTIKRERGADLFAVKRIGSDVYSKFLENVYYTNATLREWYFSEPPLVCCFLQQVLPQQIEERGIRGLYKLYKSIYSTFFGGGIVGYLHPDLQHRIEAVQKWA